MKMKKILPLLGLGLILAGCQTTADSKYSELKNQTLTCGNISQMHARNEGVVNQMKPIADKEGGAARTQVVVGALFFAPIAWAGQAKMDELYKYRHNLRENEALRRIAAEKKCPVPRSKYADGAE
jgi:hypothetical protein